MILKLENITKKYGSLVAVDNVSFELKAGDIVGLIGGNGAGKTTISEIIAGITQPTKGKIQYGFTYEVKPQERIGMQFQDSTYPSGLTVKDIIAFARNLHKIEITNSELKSMLESFRMDELYNKRARSLSGGQRQKLNILLSVIHKPRLVILDELSTGLDIAAREDIIDFTSKLLKQYKISAIIISHQMPEIRELCNRIIILDRGKIVEESTVKKIEKDHGSLDLYMKQIIKGAINETREVYLKDRKR